MATPKKKPATKKKVKPPVIEPFDLQRKYHVGDIVIDQGVLGTIQGIFLRIVGDGKLGVPLDSPYWKRIDNQVKPDHIEALKKEIEGLNDCLKDQKILIDCMIAWINANERKGWFERLFGKRPPFQTQDGFTRIIPDE